VKRVPALIAIMWAATLIAGLDLYALSQGINGTLYSVSVASIAALAAGFAGFKIKK
jgi:hypothetical protein